MKKLMKLITVSLVFGSLAFGANHALKKQDAVHTQAAEVTKRVWMCTDMGLTE